MSQDAAGVITFVRILRRGAQDLMFHTGIGSKFYKTQKPWHDYIGLGNLVSVTDTADTSKTSATTFAITLSLANARDAGRERTDLLKAVREEELIDAHVAVYLWQEGIDDFPELRLLAQIETINIQEAGAIVFNCYTAAANLDRVHYAPTLYSDNQQTQIRDAADRGLRFANAEESVATLSFP